MIVGEAEVLIRPNWASFNREMEGGSIAPLGKFEKDAETAGSSAGSRMSRGFGTGTKGISTALSGLGLPLGTFGGHLDKTAASMARVEKGGHGMTQSLAGIGGNVLMGATAAVGAFGAASVAVAVKGEQVTTSIANSAHVSINAAKEISQNFTGTMGHLVYSGQELGKSYSLVAGVLGNLAGHALKGGEALKYMTASSDLAEASQINLESATQDLSKVMQAYHAQISESSKDADMLYNTSRLTGIGVDQLATVLGRVKGKLGDLAPSLAESTGLVAALAHNGIMGRQSMTALSGSFTTLVGGGKKTDEMAKALGVTIFDSTGKFVGMRSIVDQLQPKLAGLSQQQQLEATKALFGASANKQMLDIVLKGPAAFDKSTQAVTRSNAAHDAARKQAETFSDQIKILKATVIDLAEKFGNFLIPKLVWLGKAIADSIVWLEKHKWAAIALATTITTVLGAAIAAFVVTKAVAFGQSMSNMIANMGKLVSGIQAGAAKIIGYFTAESGASEAAAAKIATSTGAVDASFAGTATAATNASSTVGTAVGGEAAAVVAADGKIVDANAAAAASFKALGLGAVKYLGKIVIAFAAAEAGAHAFGKVLSEITGEHQPESVGEIISEWFGEGSGHGSGKEGEAFAKAHGNFGKDKIAQEQSHTGGGIMAFFEAKGLTPAQAAGIVGNIQQESSFNPKAVGSEGARGLAQGLGSRAETGTITQQLEQIWRELSSNGLSALKSESDSW
jgi:TP901 family phage tail tape measure protein